MTHDLDCVSVTHSHPGGKTRAVYLAVYDSTQDDGSQIEAFPLCRGCGDYAQAEHGGFRFLVDLPKT